MPVDGPTPEERQKVALDALQALAGADVTQKRLLAALAMGTPSLEATSYLIKSRVKDHKKLVDKVFERRLQKTAYQACDVTDIIGLRILTLYRSDLPSVLQRFLKFVQLSRNEPLELFFGKSVSEVVEELIIYGYPREEALCQALLSQLKTYDLALDGKRIRYEPKDNGYSSIHIILRAQGSLGETRFRVPVEVQIRTVLEDAWGEVQHELMYKSLYGNPEKASAGLRKNATDQLRVWKQLLDSCGHTADIIKELLKEIYKSSEPESGRAFPSIDNHQLTTLGLPVELQKRINDTVERIEALFNDVKTNKLPNERGITELAAIAITLQDSLDKVGTHPKRSDAVYYLNMEIALCLLWIGRLLQEAGRENPDANFLVSSDLRGSLRAAHVLTRSADDATDFPFAIESLDESARRYFALENTANHPYDALLAFRLGEVLSLRDEPDLALGKFEEALELLEKNPQFLSGRPMRSYIPRRLGFAYWEAAETIRQGGGNSDFMLTRRRDAYAHAIRVTKQAYEVAIAALETTSQRADIQREAQFSANNLLYYSIEFLRAKGTEDALKVLGLDRNKQASLLKFIVPTQDDLDRQERPAVLDTIREMARLSGDRGLEIHAAKRVLSLLEDGGERNRYPPELIKSMLQEAKKSLET
jgi:ppGpp synthetase/RelA/SpoT-type nucleotidyltranferase